MTTKNNNYQHKGRTQKKVIHLGSKATDNSKKTENIKNIGWFYNRFYYKDLYSGSGGADFKEKNEVLTSFQFRKADFVQLKGNISFSLLTSYPGLLIGTGMSHESGLSKNEEFKLGLSFDYTSGLPVIPGSSLKGLLRSAFPNSIKKYSQTDDEKRVEEEYRTPRKKYIQEVLENLEDENDNDIHCKIDLEKVAIIENEIFEGMDKEGKSIPVYQRDIFFDAFPVKQAGKHFLGSDYITPHSDLLKNPIPIQFMKVMPKVEFSFSFDVHQGQILNKEQKVALFRKILLDLGIGAKTNVGYGQLLPVG